MHTCNSLPGAALAGRTCRGLSARDHRLKTCAHIADMSGVVAMHALCHLPNTGSHPSPRPDLKPTRWWSWASKPGANPHNGRQSAARFASGCLGIDFGSAGTPPTQGAPPNLRFALRDLHPPHHLHNMTCHENTAHAMHLPVECIRA